MTTTPPEEIASRPPLPIVVALATPPCTDTMANAPDETAEAVAEIERPPLLTPSEPERIVAPESTPPFRTTSTPPPSITVPVAVPPADAGVALIAGVPSCMNPPETFALIALPPLRTVSTPPDRTTVPVAEPPDEITSCPMLEPPLDSLVDTVEPPDDTATRPPLTLVALATPPLTTISWSPKFSVRPELVTPEETVWVVIGKTPENAYQSRERRAERSAKPGIC